MNNNAKYKSGEVLMIKMGIELENARSKYFHLFPNFLKHPLFVGTLDQKVLNLRPLRVESFSYYMDYDEYIYELSTEINGEKVKFSKLENFLVPPIVEKRVFPDSRTIYDFENQLVNGTYKEKHEATLKLNENNFQPKNTEQAINYYLHSKDFVTLTTYGEKAVAPLLEYLFICADEEMAPEIFSAFLHLGQHSIIPLLHLLTLPEYEHRDLVYYVLGEIGNEKCIDFFEAMRKQETKYINELNDGLTRLKSRLK
jgi:hypothetical protein